MKINVCTRTPVERSGDGSGAVDQRSQLQGAQAGLEEGDDLNMAQTGDSSVKVNAVGISKRNQGKRRKV